MLGALTVAALLSSPMTEVASCNATALAPLVCLVVVKCQKDVSKSKVSGTD
jgi:hypothetical protein